MNGCLLPGTRGRRQQNWQNDGSRGLLALLSPWSTVELATSSFRWLETGPPPECGSRDPIMVLQTDVSGQNGYTATKFIICLIESASSIVKSHGKPSLNRRMH